MKQNTTEVEKDRELKVNTRLYLAEFEVQLKGRFPEDYRNLLLETNGGLPHRSAGRWDMFPLIWENCEECNAVTWGVPNRTLQLSEDTGFPKNACAIAEDKEESCFLVIFPGRKGYFAWNDYTLETTYLGTELETASERVDY